LMEMGLFRLQVSDARLRSNGLFQSTCLRH
jgi:hypothetical protein